MKAKRLLSLLLALAMMCAVAASFGCGAPAQTAAPTDAAGAVADDPSKPDYDKMSMQELYDLAIKEKGVKNAIHIHLVAKDGKSAGHIDDITLGGGMTLRLPRQ